MENHGTHTTIGNTTGPIEETNDIPEELKVPLDENGNIILSEEDKALIEEFKDTTDVKVLEANSKLENYETIMTLFTDVITNTEIINNNKENKEQLLPHSKNLVLDTIEFNETKDISKVYNILTSTLEYISGYIYNSSGEDTVLGTMTCNINVIFYDTITNDDASIEWLDGFSSVLSEDKINNLVSIVNLTVFNLYSIEVAINTLRNTIYYLKSEFGISVEDILSEIKKVQETKL